MATRLYMAYTGARALTASPPKVATSTAIKTLMQLSTPATIGLEVVEWGLSFDGSAAAQPGVCELVDTFAIGATVLTAFASTDVNSVSQGAGGLASQITLGTGASGFNTSGATEGTIVASREFDVQLLPPTAPYVKQMPLERGPEMLASEFLRIRVNFGTSINAIGYIQWAE